MAKAKGKTDYIGEESEVSIQKKHFQTGHPILSIEMEMRGLIEES